MIMTTQFARLSIGVLGLISAGWSVMSLWSGIPDDDPDLFAAVIAGCGTALVSSVFLVLANAFPGRTASWVAGQHEILPAEGGKGAPVDRSPFRIPAAVLPLSLVSISGLVGGLQLLVLPWQIANGVDPMAGIILATAGVVGAVAFVDSLALIRKALSHATRSATPSE